MMILSSFHTGIPTLGCLNMLVNLITPDADRLKYWDKTMSRQKIEIPTSPVTKPGPKRSLSVLEELLICLVRLRLGLMGRQLADTFSVSQAQVSRTFTTWVCFLATLFKDTLVLWPSKEAVTHSFKKCLNTRIIIDCTEVFIEKATSPYAQRATCSECKEHNTIKALVGITPLDTSVFCLNFGLGAPVIDLLEEGDSVTADRGF